MSGPFSFAMACRYPDRIKAAASIYGVRLFGDGSSADIAHRANAELYFACAEHDPYAPKEMIDGLDAHLQSIGANARVEWYPDTHHGFAFPQRPVYDKAAAERHWERLCALFDRNLRAAATTAEPTVGTVASARRVAESVAQPVLVVRLHERRLRTTSMHRSRERGGACAHRPMSAAELVLAVRHGLATRADAAAAPAMQRLASKHL